MSRKDELLALAERVEALTGPDWEVDAQVGRYFAAQFLGYVPWEPQTGCAKFTASLDVAMSLVPEGWRWHSYYWPRKDEPRLMSLVTNRPHAGIAHGKAATPALALTAAALRAIAKIEGQQP
jgi:hypothetical protein